MSQNVQYMNYLDYLIRVENQQLITDEIKVNKLIFNNNPNYSLTSSTQSSNETDDQTITTKKYVEDNYINKSSGDLVGQFYKVGDDIKGEIFNDYEHNIASGNFSHASGQGTYADQDNMTVVGQFNKNTNNDNKLFVVGNGSDNDNRNDAFIVYNTGKVYANVFSTLGSDYAELFEVYDESIPIKNYEYKFITLKGDKAKIANHDDYILGVYSCQPAILGNSPINNFKNKYIPVGLIGKLIVYDYGKCNVDDFCKVGFNGCAIPYDKYIDNDISHYRVIKRYDENKIVIIFK